jgi:hypothetical protein
MAFCGNCGTQYQDGMRFCPRCGAAAASQPMPPPPIYAPPPQQAPYGYPPPAYPPPPQPMPYGGMYAQPRYGAKSKTVAVLLALFFNAWTWAYTFKRDKGKFFLTLIVGAILTIAFYATQSYTVVLAIYAFSGIIWLWAFFGALFRSSQWYAYY